MTGRRRSRSLSSRNNFKPSFLLEYRSSIKDAEGRAHKIWQGAVPFIDSSASEQKRAPIADVDVTISSTLPTNDNLASGNGHCPTQSPRKHSVNTAPHTAIQEETEVNILAGKYGEQLKRFLRAKRKAELSPDERLRISKAKMKLKGNMLVLSLSLLFVGTAFEGIQNLQTSINAEENLGSLFSLFCLIFILGSSTGSLSLAVVYLGLFASCLFLPSYFLNRLGCKGTLLTCIAACSLYMIANFKANWFSLIPTSLVYGVFLAPLEAAKDAYITETGIEYASLNYELPTDVINRFFGYFFAIHHLGRVVGNFVSSKILFTMIEFEETTDHIDTTCGHHFIPGQSLSERASKNLHEPEHRAVASICAVYFCCSLVAIIFIASFISKLHMDKNTRSSLLRASSIWRVTLEHLKTPKHLFLIPLTVYNGMEKAFLAGLYTKAFVGCCLGIPSIGYVMAMFGLCSALCSVLFGPLFKLFGRMPLFMFGAVVDALMMFTLLIWPPNPGDGVFFYVVAASWGMADGVWNTQISGLYADLYDQDLQTAFANHRLFESLGYVVTFLAIPFVSTETWLYTLIAVLFTGLLGYVLVELGYQILEPSRQALRSMMNRERPSWSNLRQIHATKQRIFSAVQRSVRRDPFDPRKDVTL